MIDENESKIISSFFKKPELTRGYDLRSPLGMIANSAFHHWNEVEIKDERIRELESKLQYWKEQCKQADSIIDEKSNRINFLESKLSKWISVNDEKKPPKNEVVRVCNEKGETSFAEYNHYYEHWVHASWEHWEIKYWLDEKVPEPPKEN